MVFPPELPLDPDDPVPPDDELLDDDPPEEEELPDPLLEELLELPEPDEELLVELLPELDDEELPAVTVSAVWPLPLSLSSDMQVNVKLWLPGVALVVDTDLVPEPPTVLAVIRSPDSVHSPVSVVLHVTVADCPALTAVGDTDTVTTGLPLRAGFEAPSIALLPVLLVSSQGFRLVALVPPPLQDTSRRWKIAVASCVFWPLNVPQVRLGLTPDAVPMMRLVEA